jgi:hypothetical protein
VCIVVDVQEPLSVRSWSISERHVTPVTAVANPTAPSSSTTATQPRHAVIGHPTFAKKKVPSFTPDTGHAREGRVWRYLDRLETLRTSKTLCDVMFNGGTF